MERSSTSRSPTSAAAQPTVEIPGLSRTSALRVAKLVGP
jgi:hypothetical protein